MKIRSLRRAKWLRLGSRVKNQVIVFNGMVNRGLIRRYYLDKTRKEVRAFAKYIGWGRGFQEVGTVTTKMCVTYDRGLVWLSTVSQIKSE